MSTIDLRIEARQKDLGGFTVRRVLPYATHRMVGPFIFFDHMGPAEFAVGEGIDVRPHPHIGLATVTYLFAGEIIHRDSLGSVQAITPGAVNWMTAGSGITHSERTGINERGHLHHAHGIQTWVALPKEAEECEPEFFHHTAESLPEIDMPGIKLRILAGEAYGQRAPVKTYSPIFYVEAYMERGSSLTLPANYSERAMYVVDGDVAVNGEAVAPATMAVFRSGAKVLTAQSKAHIMLLGGEPFPERRYIFWNFVSSSEARLEQAKSDWQEGRFPTIPGDDKEFIPLPEIPKAGTIL